MHLLLIKYHIKLINYINSSFEKLSCKANGDTMFLNFSVGCVFFIKVILFVILFVSLNF